MISVVRFSPVQCEIEFLTLVDGINSKHDKREDD